jgi:hypothetical protein
VPFDLYVSRAATFDAMGGDPPIRSEEFHAVMYGAPAERKAGHLYWVRYPDGDPWFVAEWKPEGNVLLSTSYSSYRYLRNFADMFDQGLRIAGQLDARLFEEVDQSEITEENIDALLAPNGKYVALQAGTWRHAIEKISAGGNAPLEYPLGPFDIVSEYLIFHVVPERRVEDGSVAQSLERTLSGVKIEVAAEGAWCAVDTDGDTWLTKVLHRPDGKWQVWPAWGRSPFSRIAETTVAVAEQLHRMVGGEIQFLGRRFDAALRDEVRANIDGLGVDFYVWTQQLPAPDVP